MGSDIEIDAMKGAPIRAGQETRKEKGSIQARRWEKVILMGCGSEKADQWRQYEIETRKRGSAATGNNPKSRSYVSRGSSMYVRTVLE